MSLPLAFDPDLPRAAAQRLVTEAFMKAGIETAALDARILLCGALGVDHAELIRDPDLPLGGAAERLAHFAHRRIAREPVSRVLGRREFFGDVYTVDPAVLDPRPDTECLVESVLAEMNTRTCEPLRILDLGTGSGAILGALLRALEHATGFGVDLSPAACAVAQKNLAAMGLADRVSILCGHWMDPIAGQFDIIVSNPPYIVSSDIAGLDPEVRLHDPHLALDGGEDGLAAYRTIAAAAWDHVRPSGIVALELGAGQLASVEALLRAAGLFPIRSARDLAGHDRAILAGLEFGPRASEI